MNAALLPLGHAPFRLVIIPPTADEIVSTSPFLDRATAELTAKFLRNLPGNQNEYIVREETPVLPGLRGQV